jgi:hypothetical protein
MPSYVSLDGDNELGFLFQHQDVTELDHVSEKHLYKTNFHFLLAFMFVKKLFSLNLDNSILQLSMSNTGLNA